jgi:hypothetical protein
MAKQTQYVEITAECSKHGRFTVQKKPNRYQPDSGKKSDGMYSAVKCPKCPWWATILEQRMVSPDGKNGTKRTDEQKGFFG